MESSWKGPHTSRKRYGPGSPEVKQSLYHSEFRSDNPFYNAVVTDQNFEKKRGPLRFQTDGVYEQTRENASNHNSLPESLKSNDLGITNSKRLLF